jgi:hypothetical protein
MSGERFTSWLSEDEREALRETARLADCSENMIVRMALRGVLFGKPIPKWLAETTREVTSNRSNTSNGTTETLGAR